MKKASDSPKRGTSDVGTGQVSSNGADKKLEEKTEDLGFEAEIDSVNGAIAEVRRDSLQLGKALGPKLGLSWARKDAGMQQLTKAPPKTSVGPPGGANQGVVLGGEGKEKWRERKRNAGDNLKECPKQPSFPHEQNYLAELGLVDRDSLLVQCGMHPMTSSASTSHDPRSLECQGAK
ncbi:hypothetical protein Dimus_028349 [Dionaea muscipula]